MKAIVLHSGGLDSSVCLLLAMEEGLDAVSVGVDYGQRHRVELHFADELCRKLDVPRRVLKVEWDKPKREMPLHRNLDEMSSGISPAFLPGRNLLFLSLAAAEAAAVGADQIWIGVNSVDFSGYPDCRLSFITAFQSVALEAIPNGPRIRAPLIDMSKPEIAKEALRLGLRRRETWSCYRPTVGSEGLVACRACDACVLEEHAWAASDRPDESEGSSV